MGANKPVRQKYCPRKTKFDTDYRQTQSKWLKTLWVSKSYGEDATIAERSPVLRIEKRGRDGPNRQKFSLQSSY
jgi:hypothetical protein